MPKPERRRDPLRRVAVVVSMSLSGGASCWLVAHALGTVHGNRNEAWLVGRAAGVTAYLLLVCLVLTGLVLSHPWRSRIAHPTSAARLRLHASLATFTAAFTVLHILVLATDRYARVGWLGAVLPQASGYRPLPVTLGVLGLDAGALAGVTAALAGRLPGNLWWPVHKVAIGSLVLVWLHGMLAGSDSAALLTLYLASAGLVLAVALSRYAAVTPADRVAGRIADSRPEPRSHAGSGARS